MGKTIGIKQRGDWKDTFKYLEKEEDYSSNLPSYLEAVAEKGRMILAEYTPKKTGLASSSWTYDIKQTGKNVIVSWYNTDIEGGYNVALLIQYGHGTNNGGYVVGIDYINPAMGPIFDELIKEAWKEAIE